MRRSLSAFASRVAIASAAAMAWGQGPGLSRQAYTAEELFRPVANFHSGAGTSWGNGTMHRGYLILGVDAAEDSAGFEVYDVSDPRAPRLLVRKRDAETKSLREIQGYSFARWQGRDLAAIPSHAGLEIWDFTDPLSPRRVSSLAMAEGGGSGNYAGIISAFWQPPFLYCGGLNTGLWVVDARDPLALRTVRRIGNAELDGHLAGGVFAVGNLLVVTTVQPSGPTVGGVATYDISEPSHPRLLDFLATANGHYTSFFNGGRIFGLGLHYFLDVFGVGENGRITHAGQSAEPGGGRGGYGQYQDGFVHCGMSEEYSKFDVRGLQPRRVGGYALFGDNDWVLPLGNLVFLGDDDEGLAALIPHQEAPDTLGPVVNGVWPRDGASGQPVTTRVGLSFSDNVDFATLGPASFTLAKVGGSAVPGTFSLQAGLANFSPDQPLEPGSIYEAQLVGGGVCDFSGNPLRAEFRSRFSTGSAVFIRAGKGRISREKGSFPCSLAGRCGNRTNSGGSLRIPRILQP